MSKNEKIVTIRESSQEWFTVREAVLVAKRKANVHITESDIYRYALNSRIYLSIYFQSLIVLRCAKKNDRKLRLRPIENSLIKQLCMLESNSFTNGRNLILSTKGKYFYPSQRVIDTDLSSYEYVLVQRLLALSLGIPLPVKGANDDNYGITLIFGGETFQLFEKTNWASRIQHQLKRLPQANAIDITGKIKNSKIQINNRTGYFPLHSLPADACFVIRHSELEKLIEIYCGNKEKSLTPPRISTPLSRLFWLACKHNQAISPLIRQPYKLLSIFEQWASDDGITDHLSGDTLKNALERGSPSSASLPH